MKKLSILLGLVHSISRNELPNSLDTDVSDALSNDLWRDLYDEILELRMDFIIFDNI